MVQETKRSRARLGAIILVLLCVPCSGCGLFTLSLLDVGLRCEIPVSKTPEGSTPIKAYVEPAEERLCLGYTVKVVEWSRLGHGEPECRGADVGLEERWLCLCGRQLRSEGPPSCRGEGRNVFRLSDKSAAETVSRRPKWSLHDMQPVPAGEKVGDAPPSVGIALAKNPWADSPWRRPDEDVVNLRCFVDFPGTEGPDEVDLALPRRYYRTAGGWVAQSVLPVTIALDVATAPIQIVILLCTWL